MDINILFIIAVILLAAGAARGWKRGLLENVVRIVSGILGIFVIAVLARGVGSLMQKSYANVLMAVVLLSAIRIIYKIVNFVLDTFKIARSVPGGKFADRLAGAALGLAEAVFVIWLAFLMTGSFNIMGLDQWVMEQVGKSRFLSAVYDSNYLVELLRHLL